jgi:cytosine/creatinine deaminase
VFIVPPPPPGGPLGLSAPRALLLRGACLADGRVADILVAGGAIVSVGGAPAGHPPSAEVLDLRGYLLLPSLVEPHAHLGKALIAPGIGDAGRLPAEGFGPWVAAHPGLPAAGIAARARAAATRYLAHGTTAIRVHVDIGEEVGLRSVEALLDVRAGLGGIMDIQIVAVTSAPVTGRAGAASRALLRRALAAGADLAGVAPSLDDETGRAVEVLAVVAADAGAGLDLHIGETGGPASVALPRLIAVAEAGFGYPVTASHVVSLGTKVQERRHAARSLADAEIGVVTLPRSSLAPRGDGSGADAPRGLAAVRDLLEAGVQVAAGGDNRQEPSGPMGHADPLETASLLIAAQLTPTEALTAVTSAGRQIMRLPDVTVTQGSPADLVAIRAPDLGSAMVSGTADRIVLRSGRIVARTLAATAIARPELHIMRSAWNLPGRRLDGVRLRPARRNTGVIGPIGPCPVFALSLAYRLQLAGAELSAVTASATTRTGRARRAR